MIAIVGAGLNHWYHLDMNYRGLINMLVFCGLRWSERWRLGALRRREKLRSQTGWRRWRLPLTGSVGASREQHLLLL